MSNETLQLTFSLQMHFESVEILSAGAQVILMIFPVLNWLFQKYGLNYFLELNCECICLITFVVYPLYQKLDNT